MGVQIPPALPKFAVGRRQSIIRGKRSTPAAICPFKLVANCLSCKEDSTVRFMSRGTNLKKGVMKKLLVGLLFGLFSTVALAAPACFPKMAPPIIIDVDAGAVPKHGEVVYAASSVGLVWGYTCQASDGKWYIVTGYGTWEQYPKDWLYIMDTAIRGTDADRRALWDKYATTDMIDERLLPDWQKIAALLPLPPPVTEWKVMPDPFRADKKRLVFTVVNGKRGPATTQYVDSGAPCDPVTTITEYGPVYFMSVLGNPNLVARCFK